MSYLQQKGPHSQRKLPMSYKSIEIVCTLLMPPSVENNKGNYLKGI